MNWYKYWYYTIFFIYDSLCKNLESNKSFAVELFSVIIYMIIVVINGILYSIFSYSLMRNLCHIYFHLILFSVIYFFNGFLFWSEKKARLERGLYREIRTPQKNLLFVILTIIVFAVYFYVLFNYREYFLLIY
jgi:uncharacterized membrane protein YidH (DUF202 family)